MRFRPVEKHNGSMLWKFHQLNDNNNVLSPSERSGTPFENVIKPPLSSIGSCEIKNMYVWGIELIYGLKNYSIQKLKLTEEISYYQRKAFEKFVKDVY